MLELIQRYPVIVSSETASYWPSAYAERQDDGMWHGYLVFAPVGGGRVVLTAQETTQSTLRALVHWAGAISSTYLEGALERGLARLPEAQLQRLLDQIERIELDANARATNLANAAELARIEATAAEQFGDEARRELAAVRRGTRALSSRRG